MATATAYWNESLECMPREALVAHQFALLRRQLGHLYERSPFYRRKLAAAGIHPEAIRGFAELAAIPFTEKEELRQSQAAHPPWGDFACIEPRDAVRVFQTSGTTGKPVRVLLSARDWFENYYEQFSHFRCGFGLTRDDTLYVPFNYGIYVAWWGFQAAMEKAGLLVVPGGGLGSRERLRAMLDWGATAVCGTPSYLLYLAEIARQNGIDLPGSPIRTVVAAGEPGANIPATKQAIESQWGAECFDDVGSTEIGNFGFECRMHRGTHVIESMYLAEALDPQTLAPVPDGEIGELVLTNLCCESVPLVRYRTGDLVRLDRTPCACGRTGSRLLGGVLGRADDMFHFAGVNVFPTQLQSLVHEIESFGQEYQVLVPPQGSGRHLTIRVEPAHAETTAAVLERARERLVESVKYRVTVTPDVEVCAIGTLPRVEGKARRIVRLQ